MWLYQHFVAPIAKFYSNIEHLNRTELTVRKCHVQTFSISRSIQRFHLIAFAIRKIDNIHGFKYRS